MKKVLGIILAAALALPMFAETDANADYSDWLPKAGDFNLQIATSPLAMVMGATWTNVGGFSFGYMVSDKLGVRATLGLDIKLKNDREYAQNDAAVAANALSKSKIVDTRKDQSVGGSVSLGIDYRLGQKHKVQGVLGAGLMYGFKAIDKSTFTYHSTITEYDQKPTTNIKDITGDDVWKKFTTVDANGNSIAEATGITDGRLLREYTNGRQMMGLYVTAGIEWFVTPKMALGMNTRLNLIYEFMNAYTKDFEGWSTYEHKAVKWTEKDQPYEDGFTFSTFDNIGLSVYMSVFL